jgi:hypothetical protein
MSARRFTLAYQDFHHVINYFCQDSFGNRLIERGDYKVIRAGSGEIIDPSDFPKTIMPGMMLEMSIVVRKEASFQDNKKKCPRCRHINMTVPDDGWMEWKVPSTCSEF